MKVKELLDHLNFFLKGIDVNNLEIVVPTCGIGGSHVKVKDVSCGFDWFDGKLLVNTEENVSTISSIDFSKLQTMYLEKVSNINKISSGNTLEAKYKKKIYSGKSKYDCMLWLYSTLQEDIDNRKL